MWPCVSSYSAMHQNDAAEDHLQKVLHFTPARSSSSKPENALVYSDPERMERMFDLLTQAAQRTQISILTCREDLFTRLGGTRLRIARG